jgi:hypothetical protein
MTKKNWFQRRWFAFRQGHGNYLSFIPSGINSVLLVYNLVGLKYFGLEDAALNLVLFGLLVVGVYFVFGAVVGEVHIKKQLSIDNDIASRANPISMEILERVKNLEEQLKKISDETKEMQKQ